MPATVPCDRALPQLDGGTDADIIRNRVDTWRVYQDCRDKLDTVIEANDAYESAATWRD